MAASPTEGSLRGLLASISGNAWLFLAGTFVLGLGMSLQWTFFNLYLREAGFGEGQIGRLLSASSLGAVLVAVPVAYITGRVRLKAILIGASILAGLAQAVALLTFDGVVLWLMFLLSGTFFTAHHVVSAPYFMRNSTRRERTYLFSWSFGLETLAWAIAAAAGGYVVKALEALTGSLVMGYRLTLLGGAFLLVAGALPFAFSREKPPTRETVRPLRHFLVARDWGLLARLTTPVFIIAVGAGLVVPFLNLYFRDRFSVDVESIGLFFAGSSALMTAGNFAGPWIASRIGLLRTVAWSQLLSVPFMLVLAVTQSLPMAIGAFLLRAALMNMGHPMARNFAMEAVAEDEQAVTNSVESLAWNAAWMFSTVLGGQLIERQGYLPSFVVTIGLYLTSTLLYVFFFRAPHYRRIGLADARQPPAPDAPNPQS